MYHSFLIHSLTDGHLGCFQHLAIGNYAAMNIGVHRFFWIGVSESLGYNPSSGIAGSKGNSIFRFLRKFILFSTVAAPVCNTTNSALEFPFLRILSNTCLLLCLWWPFSPVWSVNRILFTTQLTFRVERSWLFLFYVLLRCLGDYLPPDSKHLHLKISLSNNQ